MDTDNISMRETKQQKQTKKFFEKNTANWYKKGKTDSKFSVNVIKQRNQYVEKISTKYLPKNAKTLDVGCGTGDLVINLLRKNFDSQGIDFAEAMIKKAKKECMKNGFSSERFFLNSIFDFAPTSRYDLISANGFIEYISEKELDVFIKQAHNMIKKRGIFVLGSRNRLFNIFSFNDYTLSEIEGGDIIELIKECITLSSSKSIKEWLEKKYVSRIFQNIQNHANTGINVDKRYQYTPLQLVNKLNSLGFKVFDLIPVHIHVLSTRAKFVMTQIHNYCSNYLQNQKKIYMQIIPQSSSFMIAARKR